jgi:hypothetical protein
MTFRPPIEGEHDNMQDFGSHGVYEIFNEIDLVASMKLIAAVCRLQT